MADSVQGSENKTVQSNSATLTSVLNKLVVLVREKPIILILLSAVVAYYGALFLGLSMDDFAALDRQKNQAWIDLARRPGNNRFPLFALVVLPLLLQLPGWLAHLLIVAVHTVSAILLFRLLVWFDLGESMSMIAALLFLLWPVHAEALFLIVASTVVFGVCLVLAGTLLLTRGHVLEAFLVVFAGLTFSEGILLPALFLQLVVLLRLRPSIQWLMAYCASLAAVYIVFQALRRVISKGDNIVQYSIGFDNALVNSADLVKMSLNLASSHDVAWLWKHSVKAVDVGLLLPSYILLLAAAIIVPISLLVQLLGPGTRTWRPWRKLLKIATVALIGYVSALLLFTIVSGNPMQSRYTYSSVAYLAALLALPLGWINSDHRRIFMQIGLVLSMALLSWSMYRVWSNIWANWYPAKLLSDQLIADIRQTYNETGVQRIVLVNEPTVVGNGYSLSRYWGFSAAAKIYVNPDLDIASDDFVLLLMRKTLPPGSRFSEKPCVFLGWRSGKRIVDIQALDPNHNLLLDCRTGIIRTAPSGVAVPLAFSYITRAGRENLREATGQ